MRYSKHLCIGPGGIKCVCCFPSPRSKERKLAFKAAKRKERREAFKAEEINAEGEDA
jgi:hypothetical protein